MKYLKKFNEGIGHLDINGFINKADAISLIKHRVKPDAKFSWSTEAVVEDIPNSTINLIKDQLEYYNYINGYKVLISNSNPQLLEIKFIMDRTDKKVITIFNVEKWTDDWYILSYTDDSYIKPMIKFNYGNYGNNPRYKYFVLDRIEDIITIIRDSI